MNLPNQVSIAHTSLILSDTGAQTDKPIHGNDFAN